MKFETHRNADLTRLLAQVRALHGDDVMIVRTIGPAQTGTGEYEVVVAATGEFERLRLLVDAEPVPRRITQRIALVGPAGAGKTTTIARLALHASAFGRTRVGLLTLDTYRVAGLEHLQVYADIAGLPIEVAYDTNDLRAALERLQHCETVLIDTPGRIGDNAEEREWIPLLARTAPVETHLVLPAGLRTDVALALAQRFACCSPSHLLLTKIDEVPAMEAVADLAVSLGLPMRWATNGSAVPEDLLPARSVLASLGTGATARRAG